MACREITEQYRHLNLKIEANFMKLITGDNHVRIHVEVKRKTISKYQQ